MTAAELASELRQRQYALARVEPYLIERLSDEEIIECYVTCSHCGARWVTSELLPRAIAQADDADDFLVYCSFLSALHAHDDEDQD
jgi:hypothetical protein